MNDEWKPPDDGGPAFPANTLDVPFTEASATKYQGMSLRDYFAAAALTGLLSSNTEEWIENFTHCTTSAVCAYEIADAMLRKRAK